MGVPHGFNVFPDAWLKEEHRKLKRDSYQLAVDFIREKWQMSGHQQTGAHGGARENL